MKTYPISDDLGDAYRGSGHAIVAIKNNSLVDLLYLRDLLPGFKPDDVKACINDARLAPTIKRLSDLGVISIGMVSCWEFTEL